MEVKFFDDVKWVNTNLTVFWKPYELGITVSNCIPISTGTVFCCSFRLIVHE